MKNKLDPFAQRIEDWRGEGKTWAEIVALLKDDGCVTSPSSLSEFYSRRGEQKAKDKLFENIASGRQLNAELDAAYEQNPEPGLERLMKLIQTLVAMMAVQGTVEPKLLRIADSLVGRVLEYHGGQTKAGLEQEKLDLSRKKFEALEGKMQRAREELKKLNEPKAQNSEEERKAIVDKVDEVLGLK